MTTDKKAEATSAVDASGSKRQALIIEDHIIIRKTHTYLLNRFNFDVHEASNGQEALDKIAEHQPDFFSLIVLDLVMPVMNGVEFILKLREIYDDKLPTILVCSSKSDMPILVKLQKLGVYGFVLKPVDQNKFKEKLFAIFPDLKKEKAPKERPSQTKQNTTFTVKGAEHSSE